MRLLLRRNTRDHRPLVQASQVNLARDGPLRRPDRQDVPRQLFASPEPSRHVEDAGRQSMCPVSAARSGWASLAELQACCDSRRRARRDFTAVSISWAIQFLDLGQHRGEPPSVRPRHRPSIDLRGLLVQGQQPLGKQIGGAPSSAPPASWRAPSSPAWHAEAWPIMASWIAGEQFLGAAFGMRQEIDGLGARVSSGVVADIVAVEVFELGEVEASATLADQSRGRPLDHLIRRESHRLRRSSQAAPDSSAWPRGRSPWRGRPRHPAPRRASEAGAVRPVDQWICATCRRAQPMAMSIWV